MIELLNQNKRKLLKIRDFQEIDLDYILNLFPAPRKRN